MPARHTSHQDSLLLEANSKPKGSGRRKRVSARHQVKRPDRNFRRSALFSKYGPAEEPALLCWDSSFGADLVVRNFTGGLSPRWDLTLTCSPTPSFPDAGAGFTPRRSPRPKTRNCAPRNDGSGCGHGYRIAKWQGKPILPVSENPRETNTSAIPPFLRRSRRSHSIHREP
jgi:hypothetical protein